VIGFVDLAGNAGFLERVAAARPAAPAPKMTTGFVNSPMLGWHGEKSDRPPKPAQRCRFHEFRRPKFFAVMFFAMDSRAEKALGF